MITNSETDTEIPIIMVASMCARNRAIGKENRLLWHVPDDMKRFKALTFGHPVIMGRKTFESILAILGKSLPGRTNIVVTRNTDYHPAGAVIASSLENAFFLALSENPTEIHIGGGAEIYRQALPYTDRLYLTLFDKDCSGDAFFPEFESDFSEINRHGIHAHNGLSYEWIDYVRKNEVKVNLKK
jgi:dihydrofolate reductase